MVQKAAQTTCLDMVSFQSQGSKASGSIDSKTSFSQALDKELNQDKQSVENDKTDRTEDKTKAETEKPEETGQTEAEQTTGENVQEEQPQQKEEPENFAAAQLAAQLQQLQLQQSAQAQQVTEAPTEVVVETEVQQAASVLAASTTEEQIVKEQQAAGEDIQAVIGEESVLMTKQPQEGEAAVSDQETGAQQIQTVAQTAEIADSQMQQNMQNPQNMQDEQSLQNRQAEAQLTAGVTEAVSQTGQGQTPQTVFAAQQPVQTQTVNLSQPQQGMQNLAQTMADNIRQGVNEFEIWLEPANLGKIGVKVAYEGGRAMISIMCMSDKAMEIIAQNSKTLGAIIQQNTGTNTIVVVDQPERQDYLQQESQKQEREDQQKEDQQEDRGSNDEDVETQSFLQQLRLGLK